MSHLFWKTVFTLFAILHLTQAWHMVCYKNSTSNSYNVTIANATLLISNGCIDTNKTTIICIHGFGGNPFIQGINLLTGALLATGDCNVLALDYSREAAFGRVPMANYPVASSRSITVVSRAVAQMIVNLEQAGLNVATLHCIGHSLGAHVCGNMGTYYTDMTSGKKVARMTALDPAGPLFDDYGASILPTYPPISKDSAEFVGVLITDPNFNGMSIGTGHANIYVCPNEYRANGVQPGCPNVTEVERLVDRFSPNVSCSHQRSVRLMVEGITSPGNLQAGKAPNSDAWTSPSYVPSDVITIELDIDQTARGNFYMCTNPAPPFGKGEEGATPE